MTLIFIPPQFSHSSLPLSSGEMKHLRNTFSATNKETSCSDTLLVISHGGLLTLYFQWPFPTNINVSL